MVWVLFFSCLGLNSYAQVGEPPPEGNAFEILGLDPETATHEEVSKAWRKIARLYHTDGTTDPGEKEVREKLFKYYSAAHDKIKSEEKINEYRAELKAAAANPAGPTFNSETHYYPKMSKTESHLFGLVSFMVWSGLYQAVSTQAWKDEASAHAIKGMVTDMMGWGNLVFFSIASHTTTSTYNYFRGLTPETIAVMSNSELRHQLKKMLRVGMGAGMVAGSLAGHFFNKAWMSEARKTNALSMAEWGKTVTQIGENYKRMKGLATIQQKLDSNSEAFKENEKTIAALTEENKKLSEHQAAMGAEWRKSLWETAQSAFIMSPGEFSQLGYETAHLLAVWYTMEKVMGAVSSPLTARGMAALRTMASKSAFSRMAAGPASVLSRLGKVLRYFSPTVTARAETTFGFRAAQWIGLRGLTFLSSGPFIVGFIGLSEVYTWKGDEIKAASKFRYNLNKPVDDLERYWGENFQAPFTEETRNQLIEKLNTIRRNYNTFRADYIMTEVQAKVNEWDAFLGETLEDLRKKSTYFTWIGNGKVEGDFTYMLNKTEASEKPWHQDQKYFLTLKAEGAAMEKEYNERAQKLGTKELPKVLDDVHTEYRTKLKDKLTNYIEVLRPLVDRAYFSGKTPLFSRILVQMPFGENIPYNMTDSLTQEISKLKKLISKIGAIEASGGAIVSENLKTLGEHVEKLKTLDRRSLGILGKAIKPMAALPVPEINQSTQDAKVRQDTLAIFLAQRLILPIREYYQLKRRSEELLNPADLQELSTTPVAEVPAALAPTGS